MQKTKRELFYKLCPLLIVLHFCLFILSGVLQNQIYATPEAIIPKEVVGVYTLTFILSALALLSIPFYFGFYLGWNQNDENTYGIYATPQKKNSEK